MTTRVVRPATPDDLPQVYEIWAEAEGGEPPPVPARGSLVGLFEHERTTGTMQVCQEGGEVLGFAASIRRSGIVFVSEFYVRSDVRSSSVGKGLLESVLPADVGVRCTLSSNDPKALGLYVRAGLAPRWTNFVLLADSRRLGDLPVTGVRMRPANPERESFVAWDAEISGRVRPEDHAYWSRENRAVPVWFVRGNAPVGYGYVQGRSDDSLPYTDALSIGPIGARTPADAAACVLEAVCHAQERGVPLRLGIPGPHPVLRPLLEAGFRILYTEAFMASEPERFVDVARYIPSGSTLF